MSAASVEPNSYDVVAVGGGAAGLSAALVPSPARRRVLVVVDGGAPRNAPAAHRHGFLSRDGLDTVTEVPGVGELARWAWSQSAAAEPPGTRTGANGRNHQSGHIVW